ncbi:hypothetical protein ABB37_03468 [Leptomonas pyrrhocoris]|uniref:Uncharacterized protein n=1 Tax=Leptomonas pyrrhocoris TaxID=157538 RepID=A0A0N0DX07_LEPPY|nr:hypothetical protein ABB37_03468 [Leptomonas pyrrhocoris]KPA82391.1 hypothetical protein ABB37_03468 [Leptomonas pyrrhocoris]|eukprot:XP_015660830.1 hypothetical protein ABB37_03468 [Leptomonas pyrrhocoris]
MLPAARIVGITTLDADAAQPPPHAAGGGTSFSNNVPSAAATATSAGATQPDHGSAVPPTEPQSSQEEPRTPQPHTSRTEEEQEPPIEELVNKAVIHGDKPIEHLPLISPPELKLIGRCVTFKGDTTVNGETHSFYYEGLVGTINKETVMLIYVQRYTEEDFQLHKLQLRHDQDNNQGNGKGRGQETMEGGSSNERGGMNDFNTGGEGGPHAGMATPPATTREEREAHRHSTDSASDGGSHRANGNDFDFDHTTATLRMEEPQLLNDLGETHAEATTRVRNRMRGHEGSMGPIPYVTFSRSRIHRVEFGVDPRSSFYSVFQDPTKLLFDMQCLRMFVRRYLIHTSQGNNPRMVPLRAFVTCRCNCPDLDNELLLQTTKEELAHLIKIDRDVKRAKKKKEQGRRNVLRAYRAPNGLFRHTGVLYLTHLPRQTFMIGVMELVLIAVVLTYQIINSLSTELTVIAPYIMKVYPYIFATVVVSVMGTGCTLLHSVRMSIPVNDQLYLTAIRGLFTFGAVACAIVTMIVAGEMASLTRWWSFYQHELTQERLCYFYGSHRCSGISESCVTAFNSSECRCPEVTSPLQFFPYPCDTQIVLLIQRITIPLVCMSFLVFVTYLFDGYLHLRLFHIARLLERRM